jgi:hypothetical protein
MATWYNVFAKKTKHENKQRRNKARKVHEDDDDEEEEERKEDKGEGGIAGKRSFCFGMSTLGISVK